VPGGAVFLVAIVALMARWYGSERLEHPGYIAPAGSSRPWS
jgi:hypothetical protein